MYLCIFTISNTVSDMFSLNECVLFQEKTKMNGQIQIEDRLFHGRVRYRYALHLTHWARFIYCGFGQIKFSCHISRLLPWQSWWRHQAETFPAFLALSAANSPVTGEFSSQRPMTRNFDVFFDLRLNKRLCKQSRRRWFETPSHSLWRHCKRDSCTIPVVCDSTQNNVGKWFAPIKDYNTVTTQQNLIKVLHILRDISYSVLGRGIDAANHSI